MEYASQSSYSGLQSNEVVPTMVNDPLSADGSSELGIDRDFSNNCYDPFT
jgi:hypothetical protein